jgi:hypothetical protein
MTIWNFSGLNDSTENILNRFSGVNNPAQISHEIFEFFPRINEI